MIQINAILKKEWDIHKHSFLLPLYFVIGFIITFASLFIYFIVRKGMPQIMHRMNHLTLDIMIWMIQYSAAGVIALLSGIMTFSLQNTLMNKDYEKHFEIFHNCQPVSILKSLSTRLSFAVGGQLILFAVLTLVLNLLLSLIFGGYLKRNVVSIGLNAYITSLPYFIAGIISLVPLSILYSAIFKKKGNFFYMLLSIYAFDTIISIVNNLWDLKIKSLRDFFLGFIAESFPVMMHFELAKMPARAFSYLFSTAYLWKLLLGLVFMIAAYFIYKNREIS